MEALQKILLTKLIRLSKSVWALPIALSILKLWLTSHLPIIASYGGHDNLRYIKMAFEISDFTPPFLYNQYVLMKQPGYPVFILLSYILGFSLRFSQEILYISSGFLFAWSFYKYYRQKLATVLFLSLYIFAPASFYWNRQTVSESLYLPLTIFIMSCLIHLVNSSSKRGNFFRWSTALGLSLAWFWNTRYEGLWVFPVIGVAYILKFVKAAHSQLPLRWLLSQTGHSLAYLVIPVILVTSSISLANYLKYGIFNTNDLTSPGIKAAYSRITSVSPDRWRYMVPVPRETRLEMYAVSPSFARLSSYLESEKGHVWFNTVACKIKGICDDYAGGWFVWALRDAVANTGEYKSAPATEAFYKQVTYELEAACKSGKLRCSDTSFPLLSFAPKIHSEYVKPFFISMGNLSHELVKQNLIIKLSYGEENLNLRKTYEKITRERADFFKQRNKPFNQLKDNLIIYLSKLYKFLLPPLIGVAMIGLTLRHLVALRYSERPIGVPFYITWMMLLCILARVILIAYIDATSFPVGFRYLWPIVPVMLMIVAIGVSYLTETLSLVRRINVW
jgi:hypothetical protein